MRSSQSVGFSSVTQQAAIWFEWEAARVVEAEGGLEELSIRGFQLHHAAGGDMVLMGGSPCAVQAELGT